MTKPDFVMENLSSPATHDALGRALTKAETIATSIIFASQDGGGRCGRPPATPSDYTLPRARTHAVEPRDSR